MGTLTKLAHYSFDLVLISAVLAGVKRSSGYTFKADKFEDRNVKSVLTRYLDVGEWVLDQSVALMDATPYFIRKPSDR
ncbi:DUF1748-domain-containing protein [Nadsonia fulvescens var. elongata DSM 6958]|uniref:DUF1748-domain-containing protein n=1 Tax=Nadsonia fulvescens var. elongata DSM 6958 TaxID=857566 RepID=A0A1E3PDY9_9ASCO|nr:DUF1748-domain-containing protein [Nadsonia fulvescens var. elongata DSM 6958]